MFFMSHERLIPCTVYSVNDSQYRESTVAYTTHTRFQTQNQSVFTFLQKRGALSGEECETLIVISIISRKAFVVKTAEEGASERQLRVWFDRLVRDWAS